MYPSDEHLIGVHLTSRHAPETASDMGVYLKMHAYEMHTYEMCAYEMHTYEMHTYEMHAAEIYTAEMHACACEAYVHCKICGILIQIQSYND